jgi:hypothetical protein
MRRHRGGSTVEETALKEAASMADSQPSPARRDRAELLAKLFDLRTFIGSLFAIFGVVVTIDGLVADSAEIDKAAGINLSLWTGMAMLVLSVVFLGWMLLSPPEVYRHHEYSDDDLPEQLRGHGLEH